MEAKVYVLPGQKNFCPYPGWFRIVFASNQHNVMEGLDRIEQVLEKTKDSSSDKQEIIEKEQ